MRYGVDFSQLFFVRTLIRAAEIFTVTFGLSTLSATASAETFSCDYISQAINHEMVVQSGNNSENGGLSLIVEETSPGMFLVFPSYANNTRQPFIGPNSRNRSQVPGLVELHEAFGSKFSLTGYYGTHDLMLNMATGEGEYRRHSIPHLFSDLETPFPDTVEVVKLSCHAAAPNDLVTP